MKVNDFDFDLPPALIAQRPASPRDHARLLVAGGLADKIMVDLPEYLERGDILVFNDTRVIPARLKGKRDEVGVEVTLHMRMTDDSWKAFAKPAKKLKIGNLIQFAEEFSATVTGKGLGGEVSLRFNRSGADLMAALEAHGSMPLPPYIKRQGLADARDRSDYQTLFADRKGAVAAPTAGLHFTPELMKNLADKGIAHTKVTLHVGAGTFLPVKVADTDDHVMHAEWGEVGAASVAAISAAKAAGGKVVAIGTTSLRLLESATDESGQLHPFAGETDIFITPGYRFRIVDTLLTNFHLPRSTLFMLVSAFAGLYRMKQIYAAAISRGYRFYSYGDGCLLTKDDQG
jgi:S-adenosylmethionine:tRNA ribosyltransferase-isomerase